MKQSNKQKTAYVRCLWTVSDKSLRMVHAVGMLLGLRRLIDWGNCVKQTKKEPMSGACK